MDITVYRERNDNKWVIAINRAFSTDQITLYDVSIKEIAEFIKMIGKEDEQ